MEVEREFNGTHLVSINTSYKWPLSQLLNTTDPRSLFILTRVAAIVNKIKQQMDWSNDNLLTGT